MLEKDNRKLKKEVADKDLKISNLVQKQKEEKEKKQKKIQEENLKKQNKEKLKFQRQEIRLTQAMVDAMNHGTHSLWGYCRRQIVYLQKDKACVHEYDPIIQNSLNYSTTSGEEVIRPDHSNLADRVHLVLANRDGVFYRGCKWISKRMDRGGLSGISTSRPWHVGDLVGIIADPEDNEADIRKYMEYVMRKDAMKDRV